MTPSEKLKKHMSNKLTVMLIPHSNGQPIRINLSVAFLSIMAVGWTGLTVWSGFIASRHVDYWRARTNEQVLKAKMWYFSQEMKRSREYLDRVRETEIALQNLLNMKTKKAIVEKGGAMGGPTTGDQRQLSNTIHGTPLNLDDMSGQLQSVQKDGSDVIANFQEISRYIKDQHELYRATPMDWPAKGRLTSHFGHRRDPLEVQRAEFHAGLDIANKAGTPVHATADGVVHLASWQGGYGRLVILDHGRGYRTYYGHNSELVVKPGDKVKRGQVIAKMGTSGHSTGDHLHYEVWFNGRQVNPMKFVKAEKE